MASISQRIPDWDLEQLEVILDDPGSWQFVVAGPGAGKSAVACQRIASLVDDGIPPSRILLVSFTRTAVAELRDRNRLIRDGRRYGPRGSNHNNRLSCIEPRAGFEDEGIPNTFGEGSYDVRDTLNNSAAMWHSKAGSPDAGGGVRAHGPADVCRLGIPGQEA